jgi:hypothetical protein
LVILVILATIGVVQLVRDALPGSSSSPELQGSGTAATSTRTPAAFTGIDLAGQDQ